MSIIKSDKTQYFCDFEPFLLLFTQIFIFDRLFFNRAQIAHKVYIILQYAILRALFGAPYKKRAAKYSAALPLGKTAMRSFGEGSKYLLQKVVQRKVPIAHGMIYSLSSSTTAMFIIFSPLPRPVIPSLQYHKACFLSTLRFKFRNGFQGFYLRKG